MTERDKGLYHQEGPYRGMRKDETPVTPYAGRRMMSEPNLQNIPVHSALGTQIKEAFLHSIDSRGVCRPGCSQRGSGTCKLQSSSYVHPTAVTYTELAERIVEAVEALPLARWVAVTESLPKCSRKRWSTGVEVLVWPRTVVGTAFYGRRVTGEPMFYIYGAVLTNITHWMPLPEGPK